MQTNIDEIAPGIHRISTYVREVGPDGLTFNQFLIEAEQPLLFHTGPRAMFPAIRDVVARVVPLERLRWITFGHVESDECGSMNEWLAAAPRAEVAHGAIGVMVSLNDLCDRPPRAWSDGERIDLGGKRIQHIDTPHVPHAWESRVLFEETTRTLFVGICSPTPATCRRSRRAISLVLRERPRSSSTRAPPRRSRGPRSAGWRR